jgi:hypothetical protein
MLATHAVPPDWNRHLAGGLLSVGYDVATTVNKTSNPSSITVMEEHAGRFWERLVVRFKAEDPDAPFQILTSIFDACPAGKLRSLQVDASNEKYHARNIRKKFRSILPVRLISSGESVLWSGEKFSYKTLLGQLYVSAFEDGRVALPGGEWIVKDHRLVKNHAGSYATDTDDAGNHGDTFDSGKLAYWGHIRGGKGSAKGVGGAQVGGSGKSPRRKLAGSFGPNKKSQRRLNG